ncbi:MAG: EAL domain-containing protein [Pseudomonadota bacterium]|nr:EAL domain-containing protein [Pseudomonadota bacterium]
MQPDFGPGNEPGANQGGPDPSGRHDQDAFAIALLRATTPRAVAAELAMRLPAAVVSSTLWSPRWPEAVASDPPNATDSLVARAVREVAALRDGRSPDPRYLVLCDEAQGGTAVLRLESPLPGSATVQALCASAGARMSELLAAERLRADLAHLEKAERLQRALYAIADLAGAGLDMPEMLRGLHHIISGLMYAENFYIALYDEPSDSLRFAYFADTVDQEGPAPDEVVSLASIERGLTWYVVKDARAIMGNTEELRARTSGPLQLHGAESIDWLGVPMLRDGRVLGALVVQSYLDGARYTQADMTLLSFVAEHVLTALERKGAQEQLERHVAERTRMLAEANRELSREVAERQRSERLQAALYRLAALASSEEGSAAFYRQVHAVVGGLINARNFYIALLSEDGTQVSFPYAVDACGTDWSTRSSSRGMTEYVIRTGQTQVVDTARMLELARQGEIDPQYVDSTVSTWLGAPLTGIDGVIGVVAVQSYSLARGYDDSDAELLTFAAQQIASSLQRRSAAEALREANVRLEERVESRTRELREQITQRERAEARLRHQVLHDPLTGLPNRVFLRDRIERALACPDDGDQGTFALLYIDIDRFKQINDSLGHLVGDDVLKQVARRLERISPDQAVVARLSGDEFAILLEGVASADAAGEIAQRAIEAMREPVLVGDRQVLASASIGITVGDRGYRDTDAVLFDADVALYRAKGSGRNRQVLFDDDLQRAAADTRTLARQLREGLQGDAFVPWFEPQVRLADGVIVGHEALLRWQHPQRGVLAPGQFLQVAEDHGMLDAIDWRTYRRACEAIAHLPGGGFVSVNVPSRLLHHADFDVRLLQLAADAGVGRGQLRIEISEATLLQDPDAVASVLGRLRDGGIDTVLDDFGSGYSSLAFVHQFPLRMVKIDRKFISRFATDDSARGQAVLGALVALARSLDIEVLAEGVETQAQRETLLAMGCQHGQGFLFGRARPLDP